MRIVHSIAFRIWIIFTVVGLCVSIPLAVYYNNMQFSLLREHTKLEYTQNARITSNAIKTAIEQDDFNLLKNLLNDLNELEDYAFVAIVEQGPDGQQTVFACNPEKYRDRVLNRDTTSFYYSQSDFSTDLLNGEVIIASSKVRDLAVLKELNKPLIYLTISAVILSAILFGFSISLLSRPIFRAIEIAKALGNHEYTVDVPVKKGKDEIATLNKALLQLKENLIHLDRENRSFLTILEDKISDKTDEIEKKDTFNKLLLEVSRTFLESTEVEKNNTILSTFAQITASLHFNFMGIFSHENGVISCQYNHAACPLFNALINNPITEENLNLFKNKGLTFAQKNQATDNQLLNSVFSEIPEARSVYILVLSNEHTSEEVLILISDNETIEPYFSEMEDMLRVYFSLYSNFKRSKEYESELLILNKTLEKKVLEKTQTNLDISNTLIAQDKLATIGELSAGIAHDLNTPLAAIKAASQNIRSLLDDVLIQLRSIPVHNLPFVMDFVRNSSIDDLQLNSFERLKRIKAFKERLVNTHPSIDSEALSKSFVEAGISIDHPDLFETVINMDDPLTVLAVIRNMITLNSFLGIVDSSIERSSMVVSNLSLFTREDLTQKKEPVDLHQSIKIIESLFRFRLAGEIQVISEVPPGTIISGIEMKLFQVWSNLVKNAIDAFEGHEQENKYIRIYSESSEAGVTIHFENNGPQIAKEDIDRIFKKFFTTKQKSNGTGLGLSIVSNIVAEHYGKLSLTSDENKTIFSITFPKIQTA